MADCIFCKIASGQIPAHTVYEDERVYAFLDRSPVRKGHTLVIPKAHHEMMFDAPDELVGYMYTVAKNLMVAIKDALAADYVMLCVVGIEVKHFHIHLIPRTLDDGLSFWPTETYVAGEDTDIAKKISDLV